jgi:UDP-N-acetylglucosamine diphosphorylase / glucose-1-phosphate thymidylyltransferase / UDP-N-acetylgalactosamine diphosphorylase / glucosamine-1-phosphate N-acetyltransferase / galactosamine-1-phosphate N-acetyltransferase
MIQAVILAAGKGTRCHPLTLTRSKVLLKVANKTLIEHNLSQLEGLVDEVVVVVGYLGEMVKELVGDTFGNLKIHYVEQKKQDGTGGALLLCRDFLRGRFIVLNGDDLYSRSDIENCLKHPFCVMVRKVNDPEKWGIFDVKDKIVAGFQEKPTKPKTNLANTGLYVFDTSIFEHTLEKSDRGEFEVTDYVNYLSGNVGVSCVEVKDYWLPVGYPWHILEANAFLSGRAESKNDGKIEDNVNIKGKLLLGRGSVIKSGSYIEGDVVIGENCVIGPNCYIRGPVAIGDGCKLGNSVEVKDSVIFDNTSIPHLNYVGDSVLGSGVNFGAGTITANLRFDHGDVKMTINDGRVSSGRAKLGVTIGDNVQMGINVSLMPGIRIWPNSKIKPGECVSKDRV